MSEQVEKQVQEEKPEETVREVKERKLVVPGEIVSDIEGSLPGDGTRKEGQNIVSEKYGLLENNGKLFKVIPLSGVFIPRRGNVVIGRINDLAHNGWMTDINCAQSSFIPVSEVPRYIDKHHLNDFMDIGDFFNAKITGVKSKGIDLTLDDRGLGKLEGGMIIFINPHKVPRVIGRAGSMISQIKDATNTRIVVGQNGLVWVKGDKIEDELLAKEAINFVTERSFISGLTDKVKEFLGEATGGK